MIENSIEKQNVEQYWTTFNGRKKPCLIVKIILDKTFK